MAKRPTISKLELEVLRFIADRGPTSVRGAAQHFAVAKGYARSTILTIMERLRKKSHLTRRKIDGIYHYSPRVGKADLLQSLVREFVESTLGGNVSPFMAYLAKGAGLTDDELEALSEIVDQLKDERKEEGQ